MKRRIRWLVALMSVALVAVACGGGSSGNNGGASGGVVQGGVFRVGSGSAIDSLNPFVGFQATSYTAFEYIYPYLVMYSDKGLNDFAGDFATKWVTSADGKDWTFTLRSGTKWSDGQPMTSADALFMFNTTLKYKDGPASLLAGTLAHLKSVEAPDATTFVLHYDAPVANVLFQLQQIPILPEHIWSQYATGTGKDLKTFQNPVPIVSGGPFILTKYTKNQSALFEKNPSWYGEKPHIDAWGYQFFSNDDAMITALKNNDIDAVETVPPTNVAALKTAGFTINTSPGLEFHDLIFNANPKKPNNTELLDPKVKEAMAHAVDRNKIVQTSFLGYADPGSSIVSPATGVWYDKTIQPETFDLAMANSLLDQAGYAKGTDGIRVANGHPMSYTVIFPQSQTGTGDRTFQIIQDDFQQIGIRIEQKVLDNSAAFDAILAPDNKYLEFDLSQWDWFPYVDPDFILSVLTCGQYGGWSDTGYCDPAYDALYQQQGITTNQADRVKIVYQMQQMIYNARPYIVLDYPNVLEAVAPLWTGYVIDPGTGSFSSDSKFTFIRIHKTK